MDLVRVRALVRSNMLYEIYCIFVKKAEIPEKDSTETCMSGRILKIPRISFWREFVLKSPELLRPF